MESNSSLKQDPTWMQETRRSTRSSTNQDREAKEKIALAEAKLQDKGSDGNGDIKKKELTGTGRLVRGPNNEVLEYISEDGVSYKLFDSAYITTERSDNPYSIGTIQEIRVSKKEAAIMSVKWYYRPAEVPDLVYQMLVKERLDGIDKHTEVEAILNTENRNRELFIADDDEMDVFPVSSLRGKCSVQHFKNFLEVKDYELKADSFFYILGYNPETRRLSSVHGEVRVGPSHQWTAATRGSFQKAILPDLQTRGPASDEKVNSNYEELIWEPKVKDCDLTMYLQSVRSVAAFAGMCDMGSPEEGCVIASRDDTTINALNVLFEFNGDTEAALEAIVKKPLPITIERKWTEDEVKRFQKGLRQCGKNFFKIKKDYISNKDTAEIVEFYYLWKKIQDGLVVQPQSKNKRQAAMKRNRAKSSTPSNERGGSSSDVETESDESEKEATDFTCKHCRTTTSDDWNVGGKDGVMLCTKCRIIFKKYGEDKIVEIDIHDNNVSSCEKFDETGAPASLSPIYNGSPVESQPLPFLFKPIKEKASSEVKSHDKDDVTEREKLKKTIKRPWNATSTKEDIVEEKRMKPETPNLSLIPDHLATAPPSSANTISWRNRNPDDPATAKDCHDKVPSSSRTALPVNSPLAAPYLPYHHPLPFAGSTRLFPAVHPQTGDVQSTSSGNPHKPHHNAVEGNEEQPAPTCKTETPTSFPSMFNPHQRTSFDPAVPTAHDVGSHTWPYNRKAMNPNPPEMNKKMIHSNPPPQEQPAREERKSPKSLNLPAAQSDLSSHPPVEPECRKVSPPGGHREHTAIEGKVDLREDGALRTDKYHPAPSRSFEAYKTDESSRRPPSSNSSTHIPSSSDGGAIDDPPPLPIYPEHHLTLPAGHPWPPNFRCYDDREPMMDRSKGPVKCHTGQKIRFSSFPGYSCSRTDFNWTRIVPEAKVTPKYEAQQSRPPQKVPTNRSPPERETVKAKPRDERNQFPSEPVAKYPSEPIAMKREVSRPMPTHQRQSSSLHAQPSAARSTPVHTPNPSFDHHRPPPAHSSPFGVLGCDTPALRQLRQYATHEAMMSQSIHPFHTAQNDRELRELRERELKERLPKQLLENAQLFESMDPAIAQAMTLRGIHPGVVPGLVTPQTFDQLRPPVPYPGALFGMPGTPQVVPGAFPGFPPLMPQHPELQLQQNVAAAERFNHERLQAERALEQHYRMELLRNHQHSHVHSHLHLHPQNAPPPPPSAAVLPPIATDQMIHSYNAAALALQTQQAAIAAAGLDPLQAATLNPMLNMPGIRGPSGMQFAPPGLPGRPTDLQYYLSMTQQLQEEMLRFGHKP